MALQPNPIERIKAGTMPPAELQYILGSIFPGKVEVTGWPSTAVGGLGGFGLSNLRVGMSGEIERARLDILERMKRTTDSRAKSRLTLPKLFGDDKKETNILADVL